jgi:hypothetical protein
MLRSLILHQFHISNFRCHEDILFPDINKQVKSFISTQSLYFNLGSGCISLIGEIKHRITDKIRTQQKFWNQFRFYILISRIPLSVITLNKFLHMLMIKFDL